MKARILKYITMNFSQFEKNFPKVIEDIESEHPALLRVLRSDPNYVVRISPHGVLEFGYDSDKWTIK